MTNTEVATGKTAATASKHKLLIVEDEGEMCLLINMLLNGKGLEIEHVKTISAAVEYLQQESPSVIVLDNRLPDGFGLDFITSLKKQQPQARIIMISGVDAAARDVALENGADLFLEKPFTRTQLCESIQQLLN